MKVQHDSKTMYYLGREIQVEFSTFEESQTRDYPGSFEIETTKAEYKGRDITRLVNLNKIDNEIANDL